jgi:hypothetical protein
MVTRPRVWLSLPASALRFIPRLVLITSRRVFEQGLVEIIHGTLWLAEVMEGDGEEVAVSIQLADWVCHYSVFFVGQLAFFATFAAFCKN